MPGSDGAVTVHSSAVLPARLGVSTLNCVALPAVVPVWMPTVADAPLSANAHAPANTVSP